MDRQPDTGDVDAAGLRAQRVGFADLDFFHGDVGGVARVLDVDTFRRDAVDRRLSGLNLSGFGGSDSGRGFSVFNSNWFS